MRYSDSIRGLNPRALGRLIFRGDRTKGFSVRKRYALENMCRILFALSQEGR